MALYDCLIISPWVEAAADPSPDPSNHPKLTDDYPHTVNLAESVVDWMPNATHTIALAIEKAQKRGPLFRAVLGALKEGAMIKGYGVKLTRTMWDALVASGDARDPWLIGPHDDNDDNMQLVEMVQTVTQEGVRLYENWTGQDVKQIAPVPNQYTLHAIMAESVLQLIDADPTYWYQAGEIYYPPDPENPQPDPLPPPTPHERRYSDPMPQSVQDEYEAWQNAQGVPQTHTRAVYQALKRVAPAGEDPTYGENAVVTIGWQRELKGQATELKVPSRDQVLGMADRLPVAFRRELATGLPEDRSAVPVWR